MISAKKKMHMHVPSVHTGLFWYFDTSDHIAEDDHNRFSVIFISKNSKQATHFNSFPLIDLCCLSFKVATLMLSVQALKPLHFRLLSYQSCLVHFKQTLRVRG